MKLDKIRPVLVCEGNRSKATSLVYNECGFASDTVAKNFCKIVRKFKSKIEMHSKGKIVDAKNIMMVMVVGGLQGNKIEICAEGEDSQQAVKSLANYLFSIRPKDYINVIFLDVDGVLNSAKDGYSIKLSTDLHLKLLKRIVKATKAKIVLSSSWRIGWTPASRNLLNRFKDFGLEIMDCTPKLPESCRGDEIKQWLNDSEYEIGRFVILDDEADMAEFTAANLVQTDTKVGLQEKDAIRCIKMLKGHYRDGSTSSLSKNPFKI
ncbi:hypothetical protein SELR_13590 [Selenomonas ruminantium subsp. lactilytica TAM6421]|uniref:Phosphocarrier protein HPr n=1 Tax=Selenomonas ruminantium subsp. lactilytica (strain NBRC 103574 / TAM6421) TaxID=927704 RepID=I0GQN0_SELRL|nr:HAD domain-containing protein [Selenomonas ruminantium]BAL83067.1 hypothetical protein SELR_13590 [Selenomonas ruminantium subsp. lactilytica TAM6421]